MSKKILITGADGFIGSHLAECLLQQGFSVKALVIYNSQNSWGWLDQSKYKNDIEVVSGDIRDPFLCNEITKNIDVVFNLAALIAIPYSYLAPQSYVATNVTGTLNMLQGSLKNNVSRFVQTSTSEVYGTAQYVPIDEKHPLQPQSPYSASKIGSDAMAMSYFNSFNFPVVIARPFNTFGPRQSARAVIPTIISQLLNNQPAIKVGDVIPTRDFNYVLDTCAGLIQLAQCDAAIGKTVNIGSNREHSVLDVFNLCKKIIGAKSELVVDEQRLRPKNSEVFRLVCDNSLINSLTGFAPKYSFEQGLKETIDWFGQKSNLSLYKSNIYNV